MSDNRRLGKLFVDFTVDSLTRSKIISSMQFTALSVTENYSTGDVVYTGISPMFREMADEDVHVPRYIAEITGIDTADDFIITVKEVK